MGDPLRPFRKDFARIAAGFDRRRADNPNGGLLPPRAAVSVLVLQVAILGADGVGSRFKTGSI
jgi:hypothetical protein